MMCCTLIVSSFIVSYCVRKCWWKASCLCWRSNVNNLKIEIMPKWRQQFAYIEFNSYWFLCYFKCIVHGCRCWWDTISHATLDFIQFIFHAMNLSYFSSVKFYSHSWFNLQSSVILTPKFSTRFDYCTKRCFL